MSFGSGAEGNSLFSSMRRVTSSEPQALAVFRVAFDDGESFRLALVGDSRERYLLSRHYLRGRVQLERLEFLARRHWVGAFRELARLGDLLLVSLPLSDARTLGEPWRVAPRSLSLRADVDDVCARIQSGAAPFGKYARQIAREGFGREVAFGRDAWDRFFAEFYVPTQRELRGARAKLRSIHEYGRYSEPPEVLAITESGKWVAAAGGYRDGSDYVLAEIGFLNGSRAVRGRGAGHALYIAAFRRAEGRRLQGVELGLHPPFVLDPVLHYKRQWSPRLGPSPYNEHAFAVRLGEVPARGQRLLSRAPLVVERHPGVLALWAGSTLGAERHAALAAALALPSLGDAVPLGAQT